MPEQSQGFSRLLMQITRKIAPAIFCILCVETIFSVPYRSVFLAIHSARLSWMVALVVCAVIGIGWTQRKKLLSALDHLLSSPLFVTRGWFWGWLIAGLALRLIWALCFPTNLKSDGLAYYMDAATFARHETFDGAFWPPGSSLFLTPFLMVLGIHQWVTIVAALLLFAGTYLVTGMLAKDLGGEQAAGLAAPLLALWPGYIAVTNINSKEGLLAFALVLAMLLYLRGTAGEKTQWGKVIGSGILIGFCALTQPGFLLFPAVMIGYELLGGRRFMPLVSRTVIFCMFMLVAVLPWTYRNYVQLHRFVLISTNGGSVFYRANNPLANASYQPEGEVELPKDTLDADKEGYRMGREWIEQHPADFAVLAVRKQVVYLGDDAIGMYETLKRDKNPPKLLYALSKLICNVWWLALFVVITYGVGRLFTGSWWLWFGICFLPLVYQWLIDSVFESGSRHHISYVGFVVILAAMALRRNDTQHVTAIDAH